MELVITVFNIIRLLSALIIAFWNFKRVKDDEITENTYVLWTILAVLLVKIWKTVFTRRPFCYIICP